MKLAIINELFRSSEKRNTLSKVLHGEGDQNKPSLIRSVIANKNNNKSKHISQNLGQFSRIGRF